MGRRRCRWQALDRYSPLFSVRIPRCNSNGTVVKSLSQRWDKWQFAERFYELRNRARYAPPRHELSWPIFPARSDVRLELPRVLEWPRAREAFGSLLESIVRLGHATTADIPQPYTGVILCQAVVGTETHPFVIDYSDYCNEINAQALDRCAIYFKLQFRTGGYGDDIRIVPGGFTALGPYLYRYLGSIRASSAGSKPEPRVMGRFGFRFNETYRRKALSILQMEGLGTTEELFSKVRYSAYLRESAQVALAIDLPGNGPFCHRLVELLGTGCCVVAPEYATELHVALQPNIHYARVEPDLSDLASVCKRLLSDDAERDHIVRAGQDFFEKYLHADQLAAYYVNSIWRAAGVTTVTNQSDAVHMNTRRVMD